MSVLPGGPLQVKSEIVDDLAKTLPRWIGWIPVVGKAGYRRYREWKSARDIRSQIVLRAWYAKLYLETSDEGHLELAMLVQNVSKWPVEADRVELHWLQLGSRSLRRLSEALQVSGGARPRESGQLIFRIDLFGSDARAARLGISPANNPLSSPQCNVVASGLVVLEGNGRRWKARLDFSLTDIFLNVASPVADPRNNRGG